MINLVKIARRLNRIKAELHRLDLPLDTRFRLIAEYFQINRILCSDHCEG